MRDIWQLWEAGVSSDDCDYILEVGKESLQEKGTVYSDPNEGDDKIRKSNIAWIRNDSRVMNILQFFFMEANRKAYGFDVDYMPSAQFGTYGVGDFYDFHYDTNWELDQMYDRKLSIVIQLSSPEDYEGGDFEFEKGLPQVPKEFRKKGSVLVFPSYLTHRVTRITKGVRHSLVNWMEGPRWR